MFYVTYKNSWCKKRIIAGPVCNEQAIRHPDMVMPSLEELLETGDSSEEGMEEDAMFISAEEMKEFQSMFPQLNSQREQLR